MAQEKKAKLNPTIEYRGHIARMLPHTESMKRLYNGNYNFGHELKLGHQTEGSKDWQHAYKLPTYGLGYLYSSFNNQYIGSHSAIYTFIDIPFFETEKQRLSTSYSIGLSFNINEYDEANNPQNIAIGSDKNGYGAFSINWNYYIGKKLDIGIGAKLQHISNGCVQRPNLGINLIGLELTTKYYTKERKVAPYKKVDLEAEKLEYSILYTGGMTQVYNDSDARHYCSTLTFATHKRINIKRAIGVGGDIFYRGFLEDDPLVGPNAPLSQLMSYGLFVSGETHFHKVKFAAQVGAYVWRPYNYNTWHYERLSLSYDVISDLLFGKVSLLAHGHKALDIEWGLGMYLGK